ncbi:MAG: FCD domain-containing protein [Alphaproteobacteria bacterium]|nr:FCD domain-containing protein [Alphaproteobacteria bacterium]
MTKTRQESATTDRGIGPTDGAVATINEVVYQRLRADIIAGGYAPDERLRFDELRRRYGAGIGSLREALSRIIADGLATTESHKGVRVASMNRRDLLDLVAVRKVVETAALRSAIEQGGARWEADIVAAFARYERVVRRDKRRSADNERIARHNAFHAALVSGSPSKRLLQMRATLYAQAWRYLEMAFKKRTQDSALTLAEHERLMRATLERRAALACALAEEHIENAAQLLLPSLPEGPEAIIASTAVAEGSKTGGKDEH